MRHMAAIVGLVCSAIVHATPAMALELETSAPVALPAVEVQDMDGNALDLATALGDGDIVVLNFWATWCAPCKREMPTLAALDEIFADRPLRVVTLAMDRAGPEHLREFMEEVGAERLEVLRDPTMSSSQALSLAGLPVTLIVDGEANEIFRHAGYADWATADVVAFLEVLIAGES